MVKLPRTCSHCGASLMHYGSCDCVDAQLEAITVERRHISERLDALSKLENALLKLTLSDLGVIPHA